MAVDIVKQFPSFEFAYSQSLYEILVPEISSDNMHYSVVLCLFWLSGAAVINCLILVAKSNSKPIECGPYIIGSRVISMTGLAENQNFFANF